MHEAKAALIRMNSLTAQLRSDHGKLISLFVVGCLPMFALRAPIS
jgi:hypothetical protein